MGAPVGNRNRLTSGRYTRRAKAVRAQIRDLKRRVKVVLARVEEELSLAASRAKISHAEPRRRRESADYNLRLRPRRHWRFGVYTFLTPVKPSFTCFQFVPRIQQVEKSIQHLEPSHSNT
jgi:hypothetical protein